MKNNSNVFDEHEVLHKMKHYLPAQAALKDFIHHNTLHAFQDMRFHDALRTASAIFGFKTSLSLTEYRDLFDKGAISAEILGRVITERIGKEQLNEWKSKMISKTYDYSIHKRIGVLRHLWKTEYHIDLDTLVHPNLFRILNSYLDQGVSIWHFPIWNMTLLDSLREMEQKSMTSMFRTDRARKLLLDPSTTMNDLLHLLVGDESLYEHYLFDQQFAHPGWSGLVSVVEDQPQTLLDQRLISLHDLIVFELILEIDALDSQFGSIWMPVGGKVESPLDDLFAPVPVSELNEVKQLWQEAYEWTYYDEVLAGIDQARHHTKPHKATSFQALFCLDDRECGVRRHIERFAPDCLTYGTPGHFGIDTYYKPHQGKFYTKVCPAPLSPKHMIKEVDSGNGHLREVHFAKNTNGLLSGWLFSQTIGFWSAIKLMINIFRPSVGAATALSFKHMHSDSRLTVENTDGTMEDGLQVGFTLIEMTDRVQGVLNSIGLIDAFAPVVYLIGHGSSSVNNTHYAGYDCGACSGRPGSVNARAFATMANHAKVRQLLWDRGIRIPSTTQFLGGLHDTSRDEMKFYDMNLLSEENQTLHQKNLRVFERALDDNAKERSRRFELTQTKSSSKKVHSKVKNRTVSLFEPRPELNHATNTLCIVGTRALTDKVFLDRRAFLNSYDPKIDLDGKFLTGILNAAAPVCGGINLEYFFSRVDNHKLGAGTKLPHNVMGLIGVANGIEGDLRPGLPSQMIEVHDPIRLMVIVEQFPDVVLKTIKANPATYQWFENEWVKLAVINPDTREQMVFADGNLVQYNPLRKHIPAMPDMMSLFESTQENIPVMILN
ncbi:MAG: DUF2309 domain-containing protein [Flavobacteriales bacterium]|jgi:uncharacterized protein YbcC (UPF0753/DUF2309 family)|nr:DUF2309 domain-containing protein [Flavobacteriales bacterium]